MNEEWIPVLMVDGTLKTLSLRGVFEQAPQIAQIVAELPTVGVAIEGVLQAILRRALNVYTTGDHIEVADEVAASWADWQPVADDVSAYLDEWEHRFNILDPAVPFFQVAGLRIAKDKAAGLEMLLADVPNGTPFLTTRRAQGLSSISLPEAARWLVHAQAYDPSGIRGAAVGDRRGQGGKVYPIGPGWTARFGVVSPRAGSLARDLVLAAVPTEVGRLQYEPDDDLPAWEREPGTERPEGIGEATWESESVKNLRELRRQPKGPADVLTWQSRRIRLIVEDDRVTGLVLAAGDPLDPQDRFTVEPRAAWRYSRPQSTKFKKTVYMPRELESSSSVWRGIEALFPESVTKQRPNKKTEELSFYGPATSAWLAELSEPQALGEEAIRSVTFESVAVVLGSNMAVFEDVIADSLSIPVALLRQENHRYRVEVHSWIDQAEAVSRAVAGFAADLGRASGMDNTDGIFADARTSFLAQARAGFLASLAELEVGNWEHTQRLGEAWSISLRQQALRQRSELLRDRGAAAIIGHHSGGHYVTAGSAERQLRRRLDTILGRPDGAEHAGGKDAQRKEDTHEPQRPGARGRPVLGNNRE